MIQLNKIYNEDCLKGMKKIPNKSIDCVLTSPPYNIIRPNLSDRGYDIYKDTMTNEEYSNWTLNLFFDFDRILKENGCVLYNMSYSSENTTCMILTICDIIKYTNFTLADIIVWKKTNATPNNMSSNKLTRICEYVFVFCRKNETDTFYSNKKVLSKRENGQNVYENIFNFIEAPNNDGANKLNKATFSTKLVKHLIDIYVKPHSIVLDPFMGTGTTALGCIDKNINFIGFELSEAQVEYSKNQIQEKILQQSIFQEIDYEEEKILE